MTELEIFQNAIEIADPNARRRYVREACNGDSAMEARVLSLLIADMNADTLLGDTAMSKIRAQIQNLRGDGAHEPEETLAQDLAEDTAVEARENFRQYLEPPTREEWLGKLGHYEIESILGQGVFGIVAKAFDEKLHRVVAIKMLRPAYASTSPPRKRFLREARSAASVAHENLVAVHSVEETPIPYLVMEFVSGPTLQDRMNQTGPLGHDEVLDLSLQIAKGLAEAHKANLIHRDIKPANILLSGDGLNRVKISDFGLARTIDDASMTSSGMIAGTPLYMSPEQARGERLDHRSDLFSLGSVMYQMIAGRPPFRAPNTIAVLKRVCDDVPREIQDIIPETPRWLSSVVSKLLEKSPDDRFQSASEVASLLSANVGNANPPDPIGMPIPKHRSNDQSRSLRWALAAILSVGAVVGLVLWNNRTNTTAGLSSSDTKATGREATEQPSIAMNDEQILDFVRRVRCAVAVGEVTVFKNHVTHMSSPPPLSSGKLTFDFSRTPQNKAVPFGDPELMEFVELIEPRPDLEIDVLNLVETEITNASLLKLRDIPITYLQTFRTSTDCDRIASELPRFKVRDWDFGATISTRSIPLLAQSETLVGISIDSRHVDPSTLSAFAGSDLERLQVWGGRKDAVLPSISDLKRLTKLRRLCLPSYGLNDSTAADLEAQLPGVRISRLSFYDQKPRLTEFEPSDSEILSLIESCGGQVEQYRQELVSLSPYDIWPLARYRINIKFARSSNLDDTSLIKLAELLKSRGDIDVTCLHFAGAGVSNAGLESLKQLTIEQIHFHDTEIDLGGVEFAGFKIGEWVPLRQCDEDTLLQLLKNKNVSVVGLHPNQLTTSVLDSLRDHDRINYVWLEPDSAEELPSSDVLKALDHLPQLRINFDGVIVSSYRDTLKNALPATKVWCGEIVLTPTQEGRLRQLKSGMRLAKWSTLPLSLTEIQSFRLQFKARRVAGDNALVLQFPFGGSRAGVTLSGFSEVGGYSGIARVDGVPLPKSKYGIPGDVFKDQKEHAVDITVTKAGVKALFDGRTIVDWQGEPERLSLYTAAAKIDVPLFFQTFSEFHISDLELTRLDEGTE